MTFIVSKPEINVKLGGTIDQTQPKTNKVKSSKTSRNPFLTALKSLPRLKDVTYNHSAVSLFSGGGGLDLGVSLAGFDVRLSSDVEPQLCDTLSHNFTGAVVKPFDVNDLTGREIRQETGVRDFDLLIGGPPCQSFSILGQRKSFSDPRGKLVYEYVRIVKELKPKSFLFENVSGFLTLNKGKDWQSFLNYIEEETGYKIFSTVLNAADFGIPQIRKRVFIVGFKNKRTKFEFPTPTHRNPDSVFDLANQVELPFWISAKHALDEVEGLPNHDIRIHGDRVRKRYELIPPGERDRIDRTDRIDPEKPSGTVLVGSKAGGGRPFIHPYEPRHLTVREAARLQSFPDWFAFKNTGTWQYRAVGNAVPPLLARAVAQKISIALMHDK